MYLIALVGALFLGLHLFTAGRYAPRMPERMITHIGPGGPDGYLPRRWALRLGWLISLFLSAAYLAIGLVSGAFSGAALIGPVATQLVAYPAFCYIYRVNSAPGRPEGPGGQGRPWAAAQGAGVQLRPPSRVR